MVKKTAEIKKILADYKSVLERSDIKPLKFVVYGSYARGNPNPLSDIDVVVIAKDFGKRDALERMEFLSRKAAEVDDSLEVLGYTEREMKGARDSIFSEIINQGKSFVERSEDDIRADRVEKAEKVFKELGV